MSGLPTISVCVCTFRRPAMLANLLSHLDAQDAEGFTFDVVVVDNDAACSGRATVEAFAAQSRIPIAYYVEQRQNIALARNLAVAQATGDLIALIDDDEWPDRQWLRQMFCARESRQVDGVLGGLVPVFEEHA